MFADHKRQNPRIGGWFHPSLEKAFLKPDSAAAEWFQPGFQPTTLAAPPRHKGQAGRTEGCGIVEMNRVTRGVRAIGRLSKKESSLASSSASTAERTERMATRVSREGKYRT